MKHIFKSLLLAAAVLALAACAKEETGSHGGEDTAGPVIVNASSAAIDGEIILKFKNEASGIVEKTRAAGAVPAGSGIDEIDRVLTSVGTVRFERLFPAGGRFEERTRKEGLHLWYYAQYDPSVPTSEMARMLSACKDIAIIEYSLPAVASDYMHTPAPTGDPSPTRAVSDEVRDIPFPFNEDERAQLMQWHYNNTGNVYAQQTRMGADANVYAAWQLATGNPDVIVAVIDQGVKYDHEDLAANMWVNTGEIPGNGIDDDGNGYVDDIYGFNFTNNSGELNFSQELMHGTHVAGTIAAVNNNGIGGPERRREDHVMRDTRQIGIGLLGRRSLGADPRIQIRGRQRRRDLPEQLGIHRRDNLRNRLEERHLFGADPRHPIFQQICGAG